MARLFAGLDMSRQANRIFRLRLGARAGLEPATPRRYRWLADELKSREGYFNDEAVPTLPLKPRGALFVLVDQVRAGALSGARNTRRHLARTYPRQKRF